MRALHAAPSPAGPVGCFRRRQSQYTNRYCDFANLLDNKGNSLMWHKNSLPSAKNSLPVAEKFTAPAHRIPPELLPCQWLGRDFRAQDREFSLLAGNLRVSHRKI